MKRQFATARTRQPADHRRAGKALAFLIVGLSAILGTVGLVFDTGLIMSDKENLQHATDAAATAGAMDLLQGKPSGTASATVTNYLSTLNDFGDAQVTTNIPPTSGVYAGRNGFVEVIATRPHKTALIHAVGAARESPIMARAVAGYEPSTAGAAIVVLDPTPPGLQVNPMLPTLPSYPALVGGLEILGLGSVRVDGAVLVNSTWGGVDQNGNPAGTSSGFPWGISCTPLLPLTRLQARDIRVVGGVDNPKNYGSYVGGQTSPLVANALPVADPFMQTPVPTTGADSTNVKATIFGGKQILQLPLIVLPTVLNPGVYDWIEIISGSVVFNPGVYIIRGVSPTTGIALNIAAGTVTANGVMFYITNSTAYDATGGAPDNGDAEIRPTTTSLSTVTPSVVIGAVLPGSSFQPLASGNSPFNGLLIYQRRQDYRPIVIAYQSLLGSVVFRGTVYAKWGHVLFAGDGTLDLRIVSGTARLVPVLGLTLQPSQLLPAASDVFLVE